MSVCSLRKSGVPRPVTYWEKSFRYVVDQVRLSDKKHSQDPIQLWQ
jgi:hypothetical protein